MKDNKSGWQFPKALEIIKCKEGNKEFMKERPARRPFGNTVLICEYPIDDTAAEEPNAKLITWRLAKRAARDFLRVSFIKIDEELLLRAGLGIGYAFAPFFRGILEGVEDYTIEQAAREMQEEHDAQEAEEGLKRPVEKTLIGDCRKCWCDQCAKLEQCVHLREGALPDGVRPFPCVGCADGMRFKPCEEERCADFEQGAGFNNG